MVHFNGVHLDFGGTLPPTANFVHAALKAGLGTLAGTPAALDAAVQHLVADDATRAAVVAYLLQMTPVPPAPGAQQLQAWLAATTAPDETVIPNPDGRGGPRLTVSDLRLVLAQTNAEPAVHPGER